MRQPEFNERGQKIIRSACYRADGTLSQGKSVKDLHEAHSAKLRQADKAHGSIKFRRKNGVDIQQAP